MKPKVAYPQTLLILLLLFSVAATSSCQGQKPGTVREALVLLRFDVEYSGETYSRRGQGVLVKREGDLGIVLTTVGKLPRTEQMKPKVVAVFHSGTEEQFETLCTADYPEDSGLMVLTVQSTKLPKPVSLDFKIEPEEAEIDALVHGFPAYNVLDSATHNPGPMAPQPVTLKGERITTGDVGSMRTGAAITTQSGQFAGLFIARSRSTVSANGIQQFLETYNEHRDSDND